MSCSWDSVYKRTAGLCLKSLQNVNNIFKVATKHQQKNKINILVWRQAYKQEFPGEKKKSPFHISKELLKTRYFIKKEDTISLSLIPTISTAVQAAPGSSSHF